PLPVHVSQFRRYGRIEGRKIGRIPPGVTFALCGARNPAQALDYARAGTVRLDAAVLAAIDTAIAAKLTDMDR
ncbi:hypothetical protein ACCT11_36675, partial [Rhizobium johnstonii]